MTLCMMEWTAEDRLRLPKFLGMRLDKMAKDVVRECMHAAHQGLRFASMAGISHHRSEFPREQRPRCGKRLILDWTMGRPSANLRAAFRRTAYSYAT